MKIFDKKFIFFFISIAYIFNGCSIVKKDETKQTSSIVYKREKPPALSSDTVAYSNEQKNISPFTGKSISETMQNITPFMTIIENSKSARPQSGLSEADIIYETLAEGGIPRFLALFSTNTPKKIGPIRSVREYFLKLSKELSLPIVHCGGSEEALSTIDKDKKSITSINEIKNNKHFWRDDNLKPPHNLFTSTENISNYIKDNNLKIKTAKFLNFDDNFWTNKDFDDCKTLSIQQSNTYKTSYIFKDNKYYKLMDEKDAIDASNKKPLVFDNIVIQKTSIKTQDDIGHLKIDLLGEGEGFIISKGKIKSVYWDKDDDESLTKLVDNNGKPIPLSTGKTIWHIVDSNNKVISNNKIIIGN